jgi:CRP-like cAMP-binding protein
MDASRLPSTFLDDLPEADRARLEGVAERVSFPPGAVILAEGEPGLALYLLREGEARVERRHGEFVIEVSRLGRGQVFGEMSFVEDRPASASVVAEELCEVDRIALGEVEALLGADPALGARFYRALATTLSARLRQATEVSLAEYAWGGRGRLAAEEEAGPGADPALGMTKEPGSSWGGGSPLRDAALGPPESSG